MKREPKLRIYGAIIFAVLIAVIGAAMMTVSSSPSMKGAALLWLPAALQLIAGVWFGPVLGTIAGGLGAYAAGIIAYGGWGLPDIIMNPIAGGLANSFLPAILFKAFRIRSDLNSRPEFIGRGIFRIAAVLILTVVLALALRQTPIGFWAYLPSIVLLACGPLFLRNLNIDTRQLFSAIVIAVVSCASSAVLGICGAVVGGQSWAGATVSVGIGWFLGDTVSAMLGLYMLAALTDRARYAGLTD